MAIIGALPERLFSLTPGQNHSRVVVTPDFSPTVGHVKQIRETFARKICQQTGVQGRQPLPRLSKRSAGYTLLPTRRAHEVSHAQREKLLSAPSLLAKGRICPPVIPGAIVSGRCAGMMGGFGRMPLSTKCE